MEAGMEEKGTFCMEPSLSPCSCRSAPSLPPPVLPPFCLHKQSKRAAELSLDTLQRMC